ncbi:DMT family transporter [Pyrococcus yayanosii]|uniref:Permease n=1 Tax=Pyrococcus yayanosii (strain CH1 / JCM 16557) TaxID=529709 RepID=F8AET6_PYRYC|nr:DMT family transporter [Pyrococcus yayanosii]AEH24768.1 permease [Pyrococcus yayanosii CH1]
MKAKKAELILLGITAIWGSTFPVMKVGLEGIPPVTFITYRFALATLLLLIIFRQRIASREVMLKGFVLGVTLFFGHGFQIIGLKYTTASNSAFITSLYVVFTPFVAYALLNRRVDKRDVISLILALVGLYLISGATLRLNYGDLLTVFAAISFAFQIVLVERFSGGEVSLAFWQVFWNFILSLTYALLFEGLTVPTSSISWFGILYTATFATAIAFTLQMRYQPFVAAHRAALIYSAEPLFGHVASFITLGEVLDPWGYLGAVLILVAVWNELRE